MSLPYSVFQRQPDWTRRVARSEWRRLVLSLSLAPWSWPAAGSAELAQALEWLPGGPPALEPGMAPLVSVGPSHRASLWLFGGRVTERSIGFRSLAGTALARSERVGVPPRTIPLSGSAEVSWHTVPNALPNALPFVWTSINEASTAQLPLRAVKVSSLLVATPTPQPEVQLEGSSFGLSFALALSSAVLARPLPEDVVCSAAVDAKGRVSQVDEIGLKVALVAETAPRLRRFLVHPNNLLEAEVAAAGRLTICPVESLSQALELVWDDVEESLVRAGTEHREEILRSLFSLAIDERDAAVVWKPIAAVAQLVLDRWNLDPLARWMVEFSRAVALRHDGNGGVVELPAVEEFRKLPRAHRMRCVAHLIQQSADSGNPAPAEVRAFAETHLEGRELDPDEPELRVLGSLGRLAAVIGEVERALELQLEAARGWALLGRRDELSYPLAEIFRLAGVLQNEAAWRQAEAWHTDPNPNPYVVLARFAGLGHWGRLSDDARRGLESFEQSHIAHLRMAATRWRLRSGSGEQVDAFLDAARAKPDGGRDDQLLECLVGMDRALFLGNKEAAQSAVERLQTLEPYPATHLIDAARGGDVAAYVALHYPY